MPFSILPTNDGTQIFDGACKRAESAPPRSPACPHSLGAAKLKGDAMKKIIWAFAFAVATGMALTTAFGFGLIPFGSIY